MMAADGDAGMKTAVSTSVLQRDRWAIKTAGDNEVGHAGHIRSNFKEYV